MKKFSCTFLLKILNPLKTQILDNKRTQMLEKNENTRTNMTICLVQKKLILLSLTHYNVHINLTFTARTTSPINRKVCEKKIKAPLLTR